LKRIFFPTVCGSVSVTSYPAKAIFAFDDGQIWISSSGDKIARLQNGVQVDKFCLPSNVSMSINKLWGSSSKDLYAVGIGGNIAHWDGVRWRKIESPIGTGGTTLNINDIWGYYNQITGEWEILAVASNILSSLEKEVLLIKNNQLKNLSKQGIKGTLSGVWFKSNRKYYVGGSGIYTKTFLSDNEWKGNPRDISIYAKKAIRGNQINDIIVAGAFGELLHFNGYSWKSYINQTYLPAGTYLSVSMKENLVVVVGDNSREAIVTIGRR
jgi:hypothetical protein